MKSFDTARWSLAVLCFLVCCSLAQKPSQVGAIKAPFNGHRPQAIIGGDGVMHLVQMDRTRPGDLFYVRQASGEEEFSDPIRVNQTEGVVAGFSMAVGVQERVHVLIRTNPKYSQLKMPEKKKLKIFDLKYMLYVRMADDGMSFEDERNLAGDTIAFEGMGSLLADGKGRVFAFWHGQKEAKFNELGRKI